MWPSGSLIISFWQYSKVYVSIQVGDVMFIWHVFFCLNWLHWNLQWFRIPLILFFMYWIYVLIYLLCRLLWIGRIMSSFFAMVIYIFVNIHHLLMVLYLSWNSHGCQFCYNTAYVFNMVHLNLINQSSYYQSYVILST